MNDKSYPVLINVRGVKWHTEMTKDQQITYALNTGNLESAIFMLLERIKELENK